MNLSKIAVMILSTLMASTAYAGNPTKTGDITGRSLNAFGLGSIGHIGIWDSSRSKVIEVLNEPQVIQFNRLSTFKNQSNYWGARGNSSFNNSSSLYYLARAQRSYNPSYTLVPSSTVVGKTERQCTKRNWLGKCQRYANVTVNAVYRCDTFVNSLYGRTGNGSLSSGSAILPIIAYNNVSQTR